MDPEKTIAYNQKLKELEQYVPVLEKVLEQLRRNSNYNPLTVSKMEALHGIAVNRQKVTYECLLKAEIAIQNIYQKYRKDNRGGAVVKSTNLIIKQEGTSGTVKKPNRINEVVLIDSSSDDDDEVQIISDSRTAKKETVNLDDSDDESQARIKQSDINIKKEISSEKVLPEISSNSKSTETIKKEISTEEPDSFCKSAVNIKKDISQEQVLSESISNSKQTEITAPSISFQIINNIAGSKALVISQTPSTSSKEISKVKDADNHDKPAIICSVESKTKSQDETEIEFDRESNKNKEITLKKVEPSQASPVPIESCLDINAQSSKTEESKSQTSKTKYLRNEPDHKDSTQKSSATNQNFNSVVCPPDGELKGLSTTSCGICSQTIEASEDILQAENAKDSKAILNTSPASITSELKSWIKDSALACPIKPTHPAVVNKVCKELSSPVGNEPFDKVIVQKIEADVSLEHLSTVCDNKQKSKGVSAQNSVENKEAEIVKISTQESPVPVHLVNHEVNHSMNDTTATPSKSCSIPISSIRNKSPTNSRLGNIIATLEQQLQPDIFNSTKPNANRTQKECSSPDKNQQIEFLADTDSSQKSAKSISMRSSDFKETNEKEHVAKLEKKVVHLNTPEKSNANNCNGELPSLDPSVFDCTKESNEQASLKTFTAAKKTGQDTMQFEGTENSTLSTPKNTTEISDILPRAHEDLLDESKNETVDLPKIREDGTALKTKAPEDALNVSNDIVKIDKTKEKLADDSSDEFLTDKTMEISAENDNEKLNKIAEEIKLKLIALKSKEVAALQAEVLGGLFTEVEEPNQLMREYSVKKTTEKLGIEEELAIKEVVTECSGISKAITDSLKLGTDVVKPIKVENTSSISNSKKPGSPSTIELPIKAEQLEATTDLQSSLSKHPSTECLSEVSDIDADYVSLSLSEISYSDYESGEIVTRESRSLVKKRKKKTTLGGDTKGVVKMEGAVDLVSNKIKFANYCQREIEVDNTLKVTLKNEFAEKDLRFKLIGKQEANIDNDAHVISKRKHKRKRRRIRSNRQCSDEDNLRKTIEEEERSRNLTRFCTYEGKTMQILDELSSASDISLGPEEQRYGIRRISSPTESRLLRISNKNDEYSQQNLGIDRLRRYRRIDEDPRSKFEKSQSRRYLHEKDHNNSTHRRSDDDSSRSSLKDDQRKNRSPKRGISDDDRRDQRNRIRRRSSKQSSDDETPRKSFLDDFIEYRRSPKHYSDDDRNARHRARRRYSRSPKRSYDHEALEGLQKSMDDDRYLREKYSKDRRRYSDEDVENVKQFQNKHQHNRKRSRDTAKRSLSHEIAEKENHRRNQDDDNENHSRTTSFSKNHITELPESRAERSPCKHTEAMEDNERRSRTTSNSKSDISELPKITEDKLPSKQEEEPSIIEVIDLDDEIDRVHLGDNNYKDEDCDKLGVAIEVSSDDDALEAPPPPVITPSIDHNSSEAGKIKGEIETNVEELNMNEYQTKESTVKEEQSADVVSELNADVVSKDSIDPSNADDIEISRKIQNILDKITRKELETAVVDVAEKQSIETDIPMICDLTDANEDECTKPLEERNLNELQKIRIKLENELGISEDLLMGAINKTVETDYPPPEEIDPLLHLQQVNAIAQPNPNDPRLNRGRVPSINPNHVPIVAPPPPLIPKLTPAIALPPTVFVQVPYQNNYGHDNNSQVVANVSNPNSVDGVTYGEYKRMKNIDRRRQSVADWEQEYNNVDGKNAIRFSKMKKTSRMQPEDESSNSSDEFSYDDDDESSGSESSSGRSRKSSTSTKSKKRSKKGNSITKKWIAKFIEEKFKANMKAYEMKMSGKNVSTTAKAVRSPKKKLTKSQSKVEKVLNNFFAEKMKSSAQPESSKAATSSNASTSSNTLIKPNKQKVSGFLLPSVTQRAKMSELNVFDRIKQNSEKEKQKSIQLIPGRQLSVFGKVKKNQEKQKNIRPNSDRHISVFDKIKKTHEKEKKKSVHLVADRQLSVLGKIPKISERENFIQLDPNSAVSLSTQELKELIAERNAGPKRKNEVEKLTSDIGELKDSDNFYSSLFGRRMSSINSEIKTKEMAKITRQLHVNRIASSESETENSNDAELLAMQAMSSGKKRPAKSISDDDGDHEFTPPGAKRAGNLESAVGLDTSSLLTPLKEVPFAENHKRGRKGKQNSGNSKKQRKNQIPKNTDISLHFNSPYMNDCVICKEKPQHVVAHYVNNHRENEVYVSRLDSCQVKDLMAKPIYATPVSNSTVKYNGTCVFCLRTMKDTMGNFIEHFGSHTGEFAYECDSCELRFPRKRTIANHCSTLCEKGAKMITVYCYDLSSDVIKAYVCNLCNFIQLNSANVVKHLRTEHEKQFVTTDDYSPLTILEIRKNIESNESEEDIEVDIEVANEAIDSYENIEPNADFEEAPDNVNDNNSQSSQAATEEVKFEITFDESDFKYLEDIFNEPSPPDLNATPKQELKSLEAGSLQSPNDDTEIIFVVDTASDENNHRSSIKYQKSYDVKPVITEVHSLNTEGQSSVIDQVPATAPTILGSVGPNHDNFTLYDTGYTILDMPEETAALPSLSLPLPSTSSVKSEVSTRSLQDPTILRIMNVGFQKIGNNVYKYYCLFENCDILSTENIDELRDHFKSAHDRKWGGKCNICSKRITKKPTTLDKEINHLLSQHIQKTDDNAVNTRSAHSTPVLSILKPWQEQPSKSRKSKEVCTTLLKEYHLNLLYKCMGPDCIYTNASSSELQLHITLHHSGDSSALECCYCERSFFSSVALVDHVSKVHGNSIYQCSHCFYRSCAAYNVQIHQRLIHNEAKNTKILVCTGRGSTTITTEIMEILENRQQNIAPINCPACRKSVFIKKFFNDHIKKSHPQYQHTDANFSTYECLYCIFGTSDLHEIRKHMSNKHPCRLLYVCGRVFIKDFHPMALQDTIDITVLKTTSLVYIGDLVNAKKFQMKNPDQLKNLGLIESVNSGQDATQLNSKIINTYGESVLNFNDVETYMKKIVSGMQTDSVCLEELSELDQLVSAATMETGLVGKNLYRCGFPSCLQSVDNFSQFDRHISTHSAQKDLTYKCPHCNKNIPMNHIRLHTVQHRRHRYLCYYCADTSASQDLAISHLKTTHSHQCNSFVFLTTDKNWDRSSIEQEGRIFAAMSRQDSESGDVVATMTDVLRKRFDKNNANIDESNNIVKERPDSPVEQKEKILTPVFVSLDLRCICNIDGCPFRAKTEDELSQHFSERHLILLSGKYSCPHCSYNMDHSQVKISRIKKHLQYHGKKISLCNVCNYYHYDRDNVLRHIDTCHPYNFVTMDTATRTSLSTKHKIEILYSKNIKSAEDKYKCSLCDAILTECEEIYFHMKGKHQLNVRFGCDYPGCVFLDNSFQSVETHVKKNHSKSKIRIRGFFVPDGGKGGQASFELLLVESDVTDISAAPNLGHSKDDKTTDKCPSSVDMKPKTETKSKLPSKQKDASAKEKRKLSSDSTKSETDTKRSKPNKSSQPKDQIQTKNIKSMQIEEDKKPYIQSKSSTTMESAIDVVIPAITENFTIEELFEPDPIPPSAQPAGIKLVPFERLMRQDIGHENAVIDVIEALPPLRLIPSSPPRIQPDNNTIGNIFLICHHCDEQVNDYDSLLSHYRSTHLGNPFHFRITKKLLCVYCHHISPFVEMKAHHLEKHPNYDFITRENDNNKKCAECPFEFNNHIAELSAHSTTHHNSLYLQLHSSFYYMNQQFLDGLLKLGEPSELFKCLICGNIYPKLSSCKAHIERSHSSSNAMENALRMISNKLLFGCQHCQIFFETEKFAIKHIRKHLNPYGCNYCEIHFANHAALINHYNLLHHSQKLSYRSANILDYLKTFMEMLFLFPNGLVLSKAETEFTDYGRMDQFKQMIESMEKVELQKWIQREEQCEVARIKRDLELEGNLVCPEQ